MSKCGKMLSWRSGIFENRINERLNNVGDGDHIWCMWWGSEANNKCVLRQIAQVWRKIQTIKNNGTTRCMFSYF